MAVLHETEEALFEYRGLDDEGFGSHVVDDVSVAAGRVIGEKEFSIAEDDPMDINRFSTMGLITHRPYVDIVKPVTPLSMQIVTYHRTDNSNPDLARRKLLVARSLATELADSLPGHHDKALYFDVKEDHIDDDEYPLGEELETHSPAESAEAIADLCLNGVLTVVLADFADLPLEEDRFVNAIGVKINHPVELKINLNCTNKKDRKGFELRTGKQRALRSYEEVDLFNVHILDQYHKNLERSMQFAGLVVARAVYTEDKFYPFNVDEADRSIAEAIKELGERQA